MSVIKQLDWELVSSNQEEGEIKARTGVSLRSWGEEISIFVNRESTGESTISVLSKASSQILDWGKSEDNERIFHERLKRILDEKVTGEK